MKTFDELSRDELRVFARSHGISITGTKGDVRDRIMDHLNQTDGCKTDVVTWLDGHDANGQPNPPPQPVFSLPVEATTSATIFQMDRILCIPDREKEEKDITRRMATIQACGLIHSIKLQAINDHPDKDYQVVAGRTSFEAAHRLGATFLFQDNGNMDGKLRASLILDDADAELVSLMENWDRRPLSLCEEAEKIIELINRPENPLTPEQISVTLDLSLPQVMRRLRLANLSPDFWEMMQKGWPPYFTLGHWEVIATYSRETQDTIPEWKLKDAGGDTTVAGLRQKLASLFTQLVDKAPWGRDCPEYPPCKCSECPNTSGAQPVLFEDLDVWDGPPDQAPPPLWDKNRCLNSVCWNQKIEAYLTHHIVKCVEDGIPIVSDTWGGGAEWQNRHKQIKEAGGTLLDQASWDKCTKKDGGQKMLVAYGENVGHYVFGKFSKNTTSGGKKVGADGTVTTRKTLAERKAGKTKQRERHAVNQVLEALEHRKEWPPELLLDTPNLLLGLWSCLGIRAQCYDDFDPEKASNCSVQTYANTIWKDCLRCELISRLKSGQTGAIEPRVKLAKFFSFVTEKTWAQLLEEAKVALPDPKSWQKLAEEEAEETKEEPQAHELRERETPDEEIGAECEDMAHNAEG